MISFFSPNSSNLPVILPRFPQPFIKQYSSVIVNFQWPSILVQCSSNFITYNIPVWMCSILKSKNLKPVNKFTNFRRVVWKFSENINLFLCMLINENKWLNYLRLLGKYRLQEMNY